MIRHAIRADDGTTIAAEETGPATGRPLVLLHGIAQSRESFRAVLDGPLSRTNRLVAFDLRGHGESSAPGSADAYARGDRLGEDLHAVIASLGLFRPVIVAWSYGGVVVGEYLRVHGDAAFGGVMLVAAAVRVGKPARGLLGATMLDNGRAMMSDDPEIYAKASRAFTEGATAAPLDPSVIDTFVEAMLRVPAIARRALLGRSEDYLPEIVACRVPVAVLHGEADTVVLPAMSEAVVSARPSTTVQWTGGGHVPWLERPEAFVSAMLSFQAAMP